MARKRSFKARILRRWLQFKWTAIIISSILVINFVTQIVRKPTQALQFAGLNSKKSISETWRNYENSFYASATTVLTPDFLAAIAQAESAGDPIAQPPWVFRFNKNLWQFYSPASSAVGLMQITDGTFEQVKDYCIQDGKLAKRGRWYDFNSCWFNSLYTRLFPSHSIQLAAAHMQLHIHNLIKGDLAAWPLMNLQKLAAIIHLCGKQRGSDFVRAGFNLPFSTCGTHNVNDYLIKVFRFKRQFSKLITEESISDERTDLQTEPDGDH